MDAAWLLVTEIPQCVNMVRGHKGWFAKREAGVTAAAVSYTHLRAHETRHDLVCRPLLEKKKLSNF